jgi:hypothetical protein
MTTKEKISEFLFYFFLAFIVFICIIGVYAIVKRRNHITKFELTFYNGEKEIIYFHGHYENYDIRLEHGCFNSVHRCGVRSARVLEIIENDK